jgi:hypothetical protein
VRRQKETNGKFDFDAYQAELAQIRYELIVTRELLSRIVEQQRTITFDVIEPMPEGQLRWDSVET